MTPKLTTNARIALNPPPSPVSNQSPAYSCIRKEEKRVCPHRNRPYASVKQVASVDALFGLPVCFSLLDFDVLSEYGNTENIYSFSQEVIVLV